ncbi:HA-domain-containing protein, partial [Fragilariopsis cylindrus CCMP1102]
WDKLFQRLVAYKKQHKSTNVPQYYKEDPKLAIWVRCQRAHCTNKELSVDRINCLDSIRFVWDPLDKQWMEMYQRLVAYKKQHESTTVPQRYAADPQLGIWVSEQRRYYNNKQLSTERTNLLESIGFVW